MDDIKGMLAKHSVRSHMTIILDLEKLLNYLQNRILSFIATNRDITEALKTARSEIESLKGIYVGCGSGVR